MHDLAGVHVLAQPMRVLLVEEGEPTGPFGAKAVGEIATIPVAAAVVNAVNHALGTELTDLPLTPERILAAVRDPTRDCLGPRDNPHVAP